MKQLQLEDYHKKIIHDIIKNFKLNFYAFGSRTKNKAKRFSDLDLCIKNPVTKTELRKIKDQFEESSLPFKVDIVVWDNISEEFKQNIEKDLIEINFC